MRLLRFIAFATILLAVYLAQYIFDHRSLIDFFPRRLLDRAPFLYQFTRWLPEDLLTLATLLFILCSVGFGLLSTQWLGDRYSIQHGDPSTGTSPRFSRPILSLSGTILMLLALVLGLAVATQLFLGRTENFLLQFTWLSGLALYLLGAILLERKRRPTQAIVTSENRAVSGSGTTNNGSIEYADRPQPEAGWRVLLMLLVVATIVFGWQLTEIPVRIDEAVIANGLQAALIADGTENDLFRPGETGLPLLAYVPSALAIRLMEDALLGIRLASLFHALLTVVATWLLACELFRRTPRFGYMQTVLEDDGRWIAHCAAASVVVGHVAIHYSRTPIYLAPVAWGTFGLWALLRGLRARDRFSLAVSGLAIGLASIVYASGLIFLVVAPIWWLGVWLIERTERAYVNRTQHGRTSVLIWLGGFFVLAAPTIATWLRTSQSFTRYLESNTFFAPATLAAESVPIAPIFDSIFLENLRRTLMTFNLFANGDLLFDYPEPFLSNLLAPIFVLSIGALLLNLDRLPGWLLLSWFGVATVVGSLGANAPFWPRLLPLLPMTALAIAFGFDRVRLTLLESAGTWLEHTSTYLIVGIVLWAGVQSWIGYYEYTFSRGNVASYMARTIRQLPQDQPIFLLNDADSTSSLWAAPMLDFVVGSTRSAEMRGELTLEKSPPALPRNSHIVVQVDRRAQLEELRQRYPNGVLSIQRNLRSDPMLYIYSLTGE